MVFFQRCVPQAERDVPFGREEAERISSLCDEICLTEGNPGVLKAAGDFLMILYINFIWEGVESPSFVGICLDKFRKICYDVYISRMGWNRSLQLPAASTFYRQDQTKYHLKGNLSCSERNS